MAAPDGDDLDFDLVVEDRGSVPLFALPDGWASSDHTVGDVSVTVVAPIPDSPAAKRSHGIPVVTFHDIGLSASTCFAAFFSYAHAGKACPEIYAASAHYHITAPGHAPDAPALPASTPFKSFQDLARCVNEVLVHFDVRRAIGLGVGAGASVLTHAALEKPRVFAGLILVSPLFYASSYAERAYAGVDNVTVRGLGLGGHVKERFLGRWLGQETLDSNHDLVAVLNDNLDRLNAGNVSRFMQAEAWRDDLAGRLGVVKAKVLLITGRQSTLRADTDSCFSLFPPAQTSWIDVQEGGALVLEEHPERATEGIRLFMQSFGAYEPSGGGGLSGMYK
jgi:pimeloyl-ACP methyl ester carboxylesterase